MPFVQSLRSGHFHFAGGVLMAYPLQSCHMWCLLTTITTAVVCHLFCNTRQQQRKHLRLRASALSGYSSTHTSCARQGRIPCVELCLFDRTHRLKMIAKPGVGVDIAEFFIIFRDHETLTAVEATDGSMRD